MWTVIYEKIYVKGEIVKRWQNQTSQFLRKDEAENCVNEWNRIAQLQYNSHPENGMWIYIQKGLI